MRTDLTDQGLFKNTIMHEQNFTDQAPRTRPLGPAATLALGAGAWAAAAMSFQASADLTLELQGTAFGSRQQVAYNTSNLWDETSSSDTFYQLKTVQYIWRDLDGSIPGDIQTYCLQLYQGVDIGSTYDYAITPIEDSPTSPPSPGPMGDQRARIIQDLYARNIDPVHGGIVNTTEGDVVASALQMVIWEITHERFTATTAAGMVNQMALDMGAFQWNGQGNQSPEIEDEIALAATEMISTLGMGGFQTAALVGLTNPEAQDQVMQIPAPAAAFLLTGLLAGGARRRRRTEL